MSRISLEVAKAELKNLNKILYALYYCGTRWLGLFREIIAILFLRMDAFASLDDSGRLVIASIGGATSFHKNRPALLDHMYQLMGQQASSVR